jgi:2-keto-4-pentenoate hydratase/2-oxohepta-3-ene-1,7-dioic acid hydratase in catechol pathway
MRFATFLQDGMPRLGVVDNDSLIDLARMVGDGSLGLRAALETRLDLASIARRALDSSAPRLALTQLEFAPLIPEPGKTICLGLNYYDHAKEGGREKPDYPWFFYRGKSSLIGHAEPAICPRISSKLDYEAELAVIIGRTVPRHTSRADALAYVFGYACFDDISVRDYQKRTPQWTIGKNFDGTGAFGPWVVTSDELPPGAKQLRIQSRLNGKVMQDSNTSDMIFDVAETISLLSECLTLQPGDVLSMGTPAGVGQARTPPVWMKPGDTIEVEIDQIGVLRNPIIAED